MRFSWTSIYGFSLAKNARARKQSIIYVALCALVSSIVIAISVAASFKLVSRDVEVLNDNITPGVS